MEDITYRPFHRLLHRVKKLLVFSRSTSLTTPKHTPSLAGLNTHPILLSFSPILFFILSGFNMHFYFAFFFLILLSVFFYAFSFFFLISLTASVKQLQLLVYVAALYNTPLIQGDLKNNQLLQFHSRIWAGEGGVDRGRARINCRNPVQLRGSREDLVQPVEQELCRLQSFPSWVGLY